MKIYLKNLIEEKGHSVDSEFLLEAEGHINLTWQNLIDFICQQPIYVKRRIRSTLVVIDFKNGDVFHYLHFLLRGMVESMELNKN